MKVLYWLDDIRDPFKFPHSDMIEGCKEIERNMTFGDIPMKERCFEVRIERDESAIKAIRKRVELCRERVKENLPL